MLTKPYTNSIMLQMYSLFFRIEDGLKLFLIILSLIGFVFFDIVYVAAVMNYTAQSEIIIYWLYSVRIKVENKTYKQLDEAVKVCIIFYS